MFAPLCEEVDTLAMGLSSDEGSGKHRVLHLVSPSDANDLRDRLCLVEFEEQILPQATGTAAFISAVASKQIYRPSFRTGATRKLPSRVTCRAGNFACGLDFPCAR
jgi:hypothetical protein